MTSHVRLQHGTVAQLVEHRCEVPGVVGSIPTRSTIFWRVVKWSNTTGSDLVIHRFKSYLASLTFNSFCRKLHEKDMKKILLALKDQLPLRRLIKNLFKGHILGLFSKRSHYRDNGTEKVSYNTKATANKVATKMSAKHETHFSNYRCIYCGKYHLGKNRDNKYNE